MKTERVPKLVGSLHFTGKLVSKGNLQASNIMGVDVKQYFENCVFKNEDAYVSSPIAFKSPLRVEGNIRVEGLINGKSFPREFPSVLESFIRADRKSFDSISVGTMQVSGLIDGLNPDNIVTLTTDQTIYGSKNFRAGIDVDADLDIITNEIDGVNLNMIQSEAGKIKTNEITYNVIFEDFASIASLKINGNLNGFNITDVAKDLLRIDRNDNVITGKKLFNGNVTSSRVRLNSINEKYMDTFVSSDHIAIVTGKKTFVSGFNARYIDVHGLIDNINIAETLQNSLYTNGKNQFVTGKKYFGNNLTTEKLNIRKYINEIDFQRVATLSGNNSFSYPQHISSSSFRKLRSEDVFLFPSQTINDIDFISEVNRVVFLDSDQVLHQPLSCIGNVTFKSHVKAEYVNGLNIDQLYENLAKNNEHSTIVSDIYFKNLSINGDIKTASNKGVSNVNISELNDRAIQLSTQFLNLNATWHDLVLEDSLVTNGFVNGFDVDHLQTDSVRKNERDLEIIFTGNAC